MKIFTILLLVVAGLYANIGTITMLKGSGNLTRASEPIALKLGMEIQEGDKLIIDKKSRVQVMLNDETLITLGSRTTYTFDSYSDTKDPHAQMSLGRGFMRAITGKIGKIAPERFKVKTSSATIGIRGTGWETYVGLNVENSLCFKGEITITTPEKTFDIPAGNMLLMTDKEPKKYKADVKFFNAQIEKIEAKIDEKEKKESKPQMESQPQKESQQSQNEEHTPVAEETPQAPQEETPTEVEQSGDESDNVIENTPPEVEIEIVESLAEQENLLQESLIEETPAQVTQDVTNEVVTQVIQEDPEFGDISVSELKNESVNENYADPTSGP